MIRDFKKQDMDRIMELWLDANISAHGFIEREYWEKSYNTVKAMMPSALIYAYEEDNIVQGFVGLVDNYIAGIFVAQPCRSKGLGKKLLDYVKNKKYSLLLNVYKENNRAVKFYLREQFTFCKEQIDKNTGKIEWSMNWVK